jgi:hypothetical protein
MNREAGYAGTLALLVTFGGIGHAAGIGWPEAVGRLAGERSKAEICVAMLKGHGNKQQVSHGRLVYGIAKSDFDAVIAGLRTALAESGNPESLPSLEAELERGDAGLRAFCRSVDDLLPASSGGKNVLVDMVKEAVEPLVKPLSEAVSTIYTNFRSDKAATRLTIRTQLEAAKWPDFDEVKAAQ